MEDATYLWVAETVLRKHQQPLSARQLVNYGLEDQLFPAAGLSRTPQKSMQARLSMEILQNPDSPFVRVARGRFLLRDQLDASAPDDLNVEHQARGVYTAHRRVPTEPTERVLAIHADHYGPDLDFQGVGRTGSPHPLSFINKDSAKYLQRTLAETVNDHKQVITYTVIQYKSRILSFRRGLYNRAASFLRGAHCIGFGGHVTDDDVTLFSYQDFGIRQNAAREIAEELTLPSGRPVIRPDELEYLGVLNDDSSDVGVRHVSVVMRYWVNNWNEWRNVTRGEASINRLRWLDTAGEQIALSEFEYWSQLVFRKFYPSALSMVPSYKVVRRRIFEAPHVLCVVGAIGSGKSSTTKFLADRCGYVEVNSGRVLAELLGIPPVPQTSREEFQQKAQDFITGKDGPSALGAALAKRSAERQSSRVLIDGIRHPETLDALRERSTMPVALLYVYTPPDTAYEMYRFREGHGEAGTTFAQFTKLYTAPVESRIRYMIGDADAIMFNWLGLEGYREAMEHFVGEVGLG